MKARGVRKINIAGGEPMLYPYLDDLCRLLKSMGFVVSIVSNGSLMTKEWISRMSGIVDCIGISIDSPDEDDEVEIGRGNGAINHIEHVKAIAKFVKKHDIRFKLNITVVRKSWNKDFTHLIDEMKPDRIKVFRVLTLKSANDDRCDTWSITDEQFAAFKERHRGCENIVFEDNDDMVGSYLMFDPIGRWMVNKGSIKRFLPFDSYLCDEKSEVEIKKFYTRKGDYWDRTIADYTI